VEEISLGRVVSGAREISLEALIEHAACAATGLGEIGIGAGDAIAVVLRNDFAFFEASFAAQRLGAYSVPVNWHGKTPEISYVLNDCGAKAVVAHADLSPAVVPAMPSKVPLFVVPTPPEIATAYGIAGDLCTAPPEVLQWEDLVTCFPPVGEVAAGAISSMIY
jgi:long-chain acyl-CoA synthetase